MGMAALAMGGPGCTLESLDPPASPSGGGGASSVSSGATVGNGGGGATGDYEVVHGWPVVPEGTLLGQVSGVGIDGHGDVSIFRRAERDWFGGSLSTDRIAAATIMRFDGATGALVSAFGAAQFAMPHGLAIDANDHLWVTDVALHQVFELDETGSVLRSWGEAGVPGNDSTHFDKPTDVAVAEDGSFYVSDGYGNARIVKFDANGQFEFAWGEHGSGPGQFATPHGIAFGPDGNLYVADRGNARVQIFDRQGAFVDMWKSDELGRPWAITFDDRGIALVVDGGDQPAQPPDRASIHEVDSTGHIVGSFGSFGNQDGQLIYPHDIAVGRDQAVYVVEVGVGRRAQKFVRRR